MADNEIVIVDEWILTNKIYTIRGQQVMLDVDLAHLYGYTTKAFNQQVKRNIDRFPEDFMFRLTKDEVAENLRSQNVTLDIGSYSKYPPSAFTEQGIYMLMTVLKGSDAIEQSKTLIRLFKRMKDYMIDNQQLLITQKDYVALAMKVECNSNDIQEIKENMVTKTSLSDFIKLFDSGIEQEEILIFGGEPFKADLAYQKIYRQARKKILVVDDYISTKTLHHILHSRASVDLAIISDNKSRPPLRSTEYADFQKENPRRHIDFISSADKVHDRYIFIDYGTKEMKIYHCGASSKDAGKKITTISEIKDEPGYGIMIKELLANPPLLLN